VVRRGRYAANVVVPFPASMLVSASLLKSKLAEKGFTNVVVQEGRPSTWPLAGNADYYVTVDWASAPKVFDVPSAVTSHRKVS
jgi:hypothetical protein